KQQESLRQNEALIASRKKAVHTVAHELRTPLNAIMGYTGLIEKEHDPEKTAKYMRNIRQSSDRMRRMLNTLLAFFRLDSGKEQPCLSPCRISILTQTLETEFAPAAMHKGLALKVENRADAFVITDKERILQIGNNLLSNAIKFTENGHVSLTTDFQDGNLVLTVEDTGTGMTAEEQQRVFGAFERLSNAATQDGFGLGLSIVRHIVNMLGGNIRVESEKGEGSRFIAEIPVQIIEETPMPDVKSPARCVPMYRDVIAIDNDEVSLQMMKEMYIHEGVRCDICTNVAELVELVRRKDYSLLLTDLNMAEINGFELLELLRSSNVGNSRTIPVVVTTGSGSCDAEELQAHGFTGSLFKPFSISELMAVTDRCAMKVEQSGRPDFSSLLSYGNEASMLDKLTTETEKEMQALREAKYRNDLEGLNALTHHLRSSWEILRADQPLKVLYRLLHGEGTPDNEALSHAVDGVLEKGAEIIRLSKEERRKYGQE
ncbi:hybrid sensor histidine kinase/response regulator, partial [Bacteroides fragilis]|nr:hybrid sensor histidine kinase/response regulator [Bacteroides fragilis]